MVKYSLYRKVGKRWVRLCKSEYPLQEARRLYQNQLICGLGELRRVKPTDKAVDYILVPAYGRTYTSEAEVLQAWGEKKDFQFVGHSAVANIDDFKEPTNLLIDYGVGAVCISTVGNCLQPS